MPNLSKAKLVECLNIILARSSKAEPEEATHQGRLHIIGGAGSSVRIEIAGQPVVNAQVPEGAPPTVYVWGDGLSARAAFLEECELDDVLGTQVSREFLEKRLDARIVSLVAEGKEAVDEPVIRQFLREARESVKDWTVYLPVDNLQLVGVAVFELGDVTFTSAQVALTELVQKAWENIDQAAATPEEKSITKINVTSTAFGGYGPYHACARTVVNSEAGRAGQIASDKVATVLNVLRCFTHLITRRDARAFIGLAGMVPRQKRLSFIFAENETFINSEVIGALQEYRVDTEVQSYLQEQCAIGRFDEVLKKPANSRTKLENAVFVAAQWIGSGVVAQEPAQKVLHHTIGLEGLLHGLGGEAIADKLSMRVAYLLAGENLRETYRLAKRLYGLRSLVAHTGESNFPYDDVVLLEDMAVRALIAMVKRVNEWPSQVEFAAWVEEQSLRPLPE